MYLYSWGANSYGQLGLGHKSATEPTAKVVDLSNLGLDASHIVAVAGGHGHVLLLDTNGFVYSCGCNSHGQLGFSYDTLKFTQIDFLKDFRIVRISCGNDLSAAISECGELFVWGNNDCTKLGLANSIHSTSIPSRVQVSKKLATGFKDMVGCEGHTVMLTRENGVLVAGRGHEGQLGVGDNYGDNNYITIRKVATLKDIISVTCGQYHTVALNENGTIFSCGKNVNGQLGRDPNVSQSSVPLETYRGKSPAESIVSVHAGYNHSAALTKKGAVLTWGNNVAGQLGEARAVPFQPRPINSLSDVTALSVGSEHSLAITAEGALFVWGRNMHGCCGTGDCANVPVPQRIFKEHKVMKAFACSDSSFAIVE